MIILFGGSVISISCYGQAPVITYPSPKTYIINIPIPPLSPNNTGGVVPPNIYGLVSLFAGQTGVQGATTGGVGQSQFITPFTICTNSLGNIFVNDPGNRAIKEISSGGNVVYRSQGVPVVPGVALEPNNFNNPTGIAADAADNVYIADTDNNLIRKVAADNTPSIFAGNRTPFSFDSIGAAAGFNKPTEMTIDAAGNLYIVDGGSSNNKIRKITPAGVVTTLFILTNTTKIGGIVRDNNGNFFITKPTENTIEKVSPAGIATVFAGTGVAGSTDGTATKATFNTPGGIAIDGENDLYVTSSTDNLVRKVTFAGVVTTFAGQLAPGAVNGDRSIASFNHPQGIAIDQTGNIYISDSGNYTIRRIAAAGYIIDKALPSGLVFDNKTGMITGTPTALSPPTNYTITAYNFYGSSATIINLQVILSADLVFDPIGIKTTCDADFAPATSANTITYTSSNSGVANIVNGQVHIVGAGTAVITATDGKSTSSQTLTVNYVAVPTISISASANAVCAGIPIRFTASAQNTGTAPTYQWLVNGVSKSTNTSYTDVFSNGDLVSCTLQANTVCIVPVSSNVITANVSALPAVSFAASEIGIKQGESIQLLPIISGDITTYQWSPSSGLSNSAAENPIASPTVKTTYNLLVTTALGCQANASITVDVINSIAIHNAFSPNGDGINDTWNIPDLAYFPGCTVKIYNRYGNLIFDTVNYIKAWDGTFKGTDLPTGTYYYIIDPKNKTPLVSGEVTLIR